MSCIVHDVNFQQTKLITNEEILVNVFRKKLSLFHLITFATLVMEVIRKKLRKCGT